MNVDVSNPSKANTYIYIRENRQRRDAARNPCLLRRSRQLTGADPDGRGVLLEQGMCRRVEDQILPKEASVSAMHRDKKDSSNGNVSVDAEIQSRGVRNDASLVPPIRQTASIFKQPVTVYKTQEGKVKADFKHGVQEKPKQLFWEKRLEGLRACDLDGFEFDAMELPRALRAVGPHVGEETLLQSVATALHVSTQPVTGQTGSRSALEKNPGVFLNPDQPLVQAVAVADEDIKRQEERVATARKKLQDALKRFVA